MTSRTEVPEGTMNLINSVAGKAGYTGKRFDSKVSRWKLVEKAMHYVNEHLSIFKL